MGVLKYAPHALFKFIEKYAYAVGNYKESSCVIGAVSFVYCVPKVIKPIYIVQWGAALTMMRREKRDRKHFKCMRCPVDHLLDVDTDDASRRCSNGFFGED